MNTRRSFLAGVGAAVSGLALPGLVEACGCRRRRHRRECCSQGRFQHESFAGSCQWACPLNYYGMMNNIYYYYCRCCPGPGPNIDAHDNVAHNGPYDCNSGTNCISLGSRMPYSSSAACGHPEASGIPCANRGHHSSKHCVKDGIAKKIPPDQTDFDKHGDVVVTSVTAKNVKYKDPTAASGWRYIRVFDFTAPFGSLLIGQETTDQQTAEDFDHKSNPGGGHYHVINPKSASVRCYHILTVR